MARYVYLCPVCKNKFEVDKPMELSGSPAPCPNCDFYETMKLYFPPSYNIKGLSKDRFRKE
jgi:putative FmdB family regulatory protein